MEKISQNHEQNHPDEKAYIPSNADEQTHGHKRADDEHTHGQKFVDDEHVHHQHAHSQTKAVLNRLSRMVGHLKAVRTMVEQGRDCSEVLIQLAAIRAAVNKTCEIILKDHLENCIVEAVNTGDTKALDEMNRAVELLMK